MASLLRLSAVLLAALLLVPAGASAAGNQQRLDSTVRYLQDVQHRDGGFGEKGSDPSFSAWAALALASAGINPRDQKQPGGTDVYTYLTRHTGGLTQSTEYARLLLVANASGTSPERFGPINPLARLLKLQRADGGFGQPPSRPGSTINGTAYAVLAMVGTERSGLRARQGRALDWLLAHQAPDGSWDGTDLTGSVIEALNAGGRKRTPQQALALNYLRSRQNPDGGFSTRNVGDLSTTGSTAFIVRGLVAARLGATALVAESGKTPLDYLASMQQTDGSVRNSASDAANPAYITAFTTPALAGASLPLAAVDRADPEDTTSRRSETPAKPRGDDGTQPGAGGTADGGDGEVTAGGGGDSAPLFSQPKPGSRGVQPGGQRQTDQPSRATGEGDGAVAGESVAGKLVGQGKLAAGGKGRSLGSAPGLRAAAAGGEAPKGLVAGIGVALVLSAFGGMYLERRGTKGRAS